VRQEVEYEIREQDGIQSALAWADQMVRKGLQAGTVVMRLGRPRRTLDQNKKLWPMCTDVARQVEWHGQRLSKEDWKDLFVGSLKGQTPVPGINGGVVFIGGGSSKLNVGQFCELIESIYAFGSENGVVWSEGSKEAIDYAKERRDGRRSAA
jgi:hypothetical protein